MPLEMQFLDARQGDAIWIRWGRSRQMMIDMGTPATGAALAHRLRAVPEHRRAFDLLVITHVDGDHIGGVLTCVSDPDEPVPGLTFADVWFNGWEHLSGGEPRTDGVQLEHMGGAQGEALSAWLRQQSWNAAFGRAPAVRSDTALPRVDLGEGLSLSVLAPTQTRLRSLQPDWRSNVEAAIDKGRLEEVSPGLESLGPSSPPVLASRVDLELLADARSPVDASKANGASITLLLEWEGRRVLLTGDAPASELTAGLALVGGGDPVQLDLIKVPHHGSRKNVTRQLVQAVDCPLWVFSTDGTTFRHPDAQAIARILHYGRHSRPTLAFNVPSTYNRWWDDATWRGLFGYDVLYGEVGDGLTIRLPPTALTSGAPRPTISHGVAMSRAGARARGAGGTP